jgi:hypothetical protein
MRPRWSSLQLLSYSLCCVYFATATWTAHFGVKAVHHLTTIRSNLNTDGLVSDYDVLHVSSTHVLLHIPLDRHMIHLSMLYSIIGTSVSCASNFNDIGVFYMPMQSNLVAIPCTALLTTREWLHYFVCLVFHQHKTRGLVTYHKRGWAVAAALLFSPSWSITHFLQHHSALLHPS